MSKMNSNDEMDIKFSPEEELRWRTKTEVCRRAELLGCIG